MDEELYSRQLYVLGLPAMQRIQRARVLLSGLRGLGAEVAKNLVLMGVGSLTLHDPHPTCWADLAAQFFLSEESLGRSRAEASQAPLAQLNEAVQISVHTGDITEDLLLAFQVVVLTNSKLEEQLKVGTFCHKHGIYFLVAETPGLVGRVFCDFGEDFTVADPTEVEPMTAAIQDISQGLPGIVTLRGDTKRHSFRDGDLVIFSGIEGMVELNNCSPQPVHVQNGSLEIGDTSAFSRYLRGGVITEVKRPKTVRHKSLDTALLQPHVVVQSTQEAQRAHCLHQAFLALHKFQQLHGRLPKPWDPVDAETVVRVAQDLEPLTGTKEESLDEALLRKFALCSAGSLSPMAAILGGVAAQEVLKAISGKFMPLDQWLYFDALECLPEDEELLPNPEDCHPRNCRYDGQIAVFGTGFQQKLSYQHYLLQVGAGAIGCEMLKSFALMGLGVRANGGVAVADMDHIERSNLSRQFLFRPQDIGKPKAEVAATAAQRLNPDLQVTFYTNPLDPTTQHIFGDDFFSRVDGVVAALDSFEARHYVAARCTHYLKPLLEAGTQGTRGSASVFVPHVTEVYKGPISAADPEGVPHPLCTLRYFPSTVEHILQWARDEFEGLFSRSAETINCYQEACTSLSGMDRTQTLILLQQVMGVLKRRPKTWEDCVVWALGHWQLCFHDGIVELLRQFPPDKVLKDGTLFWSGSKSCPQPLQFDPNQDMHFLYVLAAANLYAQMHGLLGSHDQTALKELLQLLPEPASMHQSLISDGAFTAAEFGPEQLKELQELLRDWSKGPRLKPVLFEKNDDSNFHVDFVVAATDLRAQNYGILPVNHAQIKQIVGRIIPAIATSTAVVAGLLGLELYKVVSGPRPLSTFRRSYLHLAENYFIRSVPSAPALQLFQHLKWTCWDHLKVPAGQPERTLESLLAHLQEEQALKVEMLLYGPYILYSAQWPLEKQARCLCLRVTELVQQVTGREPEPGLRVLVLELSCEGEGDETAFPPLHYELW
ncbi:ubiquitin-like modifier-activating enzyme 7 isoform X3 [Cricetulus griseus]|uniref:Ubiquitin-like modifier-activating enzyme 7 n=1 Tax=Cricetulus griseus TaxID=10029 RepID=A0A9J7JQ31_CRIGR|nr:ubiquitin-like modifier-activating enzyme 7 isoform X3 [Cricetulus griseus]XP_027270317.1 ubiquitin-like modifier-activating enzyme 7 isoform X3 [Cricetulus griseus]